MIIKLATDNGWQFIDKVETISTVMKKVPGQSDKIEKIVYQAGNQVGVIHVPNNSYSVYLMNDEGKTIERLN